jgi:hypothetical protein
LSRLASERAIYHWHGERSIALPANLWQANLSLPHSKDGNRNLLSKMEEVDKLPEAGKAIIEAVLNFFLDTSAAVFSSWAHTDDNTVTAC